MVADGMLDEIVIMNLKPATVLGVSLVPKICLEVLYYIFKHF